QNVVHPLDGDAGVGRQAVANAETMAERAVADVAVDVRAQIADGHAEIAARAPDAAAELEELLGRAINDALDLGEDFLIGLHGCLRRSNYRDGAQAGERSANGKTFPKMGKVFPMRTEIELMAGCFLLCRRPQRRCPASAKTRSRC